MKKIGTPTQVFRKIFFAKIFIGSDGFRILISYKFANVKYIVVILR